jgi:hypothetical protein
MSARCTGNSTNESEYSGYLIIRTNIISHIKIRKKTLLIVEQLPININ